MNILGINLEVQRFCDQHKIIKSYHNEPLVNIMSQNLEYPLVWFIPQSSNIKSGAMYHSVKVLFLELTDKDNSSVIESYSNTLSLAADFNTYFYNNSDKFGFDMNIQSDIEPIMMDFSDAACGCAMTVEFQSRLWHDENQILLND